VRRLPVTCCHVSRVCVVIAMLTCVHSGSHYWHRRCGGSVVHRRHRRRRVRSAQSATISGRRLVCIAQSGVPQCQVSEMKKYRCKESFIQMCRSVQPSHFFSSNTLRNTTSPITCVNGAASTYETKCCAVSLATGVLTNLPAGASKALICRRCSRCLRQTSFCNRKYFG
jgi:hypothetical protein